MVHVWVRRVYSNWRPARRDEANLELGEKSGTGSPWCNSKFASDWRVSPHFSDTLSGRSVSLVRDIIICNWNDLDACVISRCLLATCRPKC